jgi:hypothetical protein
MESGSDPDQSALAEDGLGLDDDLLLDDLDDRPNPLFGLLAFVVVVVIVFVLTRRARGARA